LLGGLEPRVADGRHSEAVDADPAQRGVGAQVAMAHSTTANQTDREPVYLRTSALIP
jgi:hypothetical protein